MIEFIIADSMKDKKVITPSDKKMADTYRVML